MRNHLHTIPLLVVALAGSAGAQAMRRERSALEEQRLSDVRALYDQPSWPVGAARRGLPIDLALAGWSADPLQSDAGLVTRSFRTPTAEQPSFVLETIVEESQQAAQARLIEWLAGLQSAQRMPSTSALGLVVGDAGFAGRSGAGPRALAWIAFVRGNVAVRVSAFDAAHEPGLDLAGIAAAVDAAIVQSPALETGAAPAKPVIERLELPTGTFGVVEGSKVRLDVRVVDPAGAQPHLQWVVGGPGQGYVERAENGDWVLHTTGPGRITLGLEVTASTGTWARRAVALTVLDDC